MNYLYVSTSEQLKEVCKELSIFKELAIDLECENNLHHYGSYITLIQISSKTKNWVIDILTVDNITPLIKILEDKNITKIFHDISFDFRILNKQFNCHPKNIFDTQIAALLLGKKELGLGSLLESYLNIKKQSKFQMADWTKRPISNEMLSYAIKDTQYLIKIKSLLFKELKDKKRLKWMEEECKELENKDFIYVQGTYTDLRGYKFLSDIERGILKKLYQLREKLAKKVDRPVHFIMNNHLLIELSKNPPNSFKDWKNLSHVHPIVKVRCQEFMRAVEIGRKYPIKIIESKPKKFSKQQRDKARKLNLIQEKIANDQKITKHLIMNKDQIKDIVLNNNFNSLRDWQKELVKKEL